MSKKTEYDVGYGKPPQHTRFKKGRSGNPDGRPKAARNFATDLEAVLNERIQITENGKPKSVSSQVAALKRLKAEALKGNARALDRLLDLAAAHSAEKEAQSQERSLSEAEADILMRYEHDVLHRAGVETGPDQDGSEADAPSN
ncbi:hypothetical protein FIU97_13395 [Roseivivax sp. THAF40]|uniref:DUF5681 domain-containing protein n=1 Tax=unclassified Roseivivax TaxID=2639302 RepID=UPI0012698363|nr:MULTISPECIES: DUF5681 domain-containing protein [unclassified Roseivivax]QFS83767.1 hypothetical protein FIV09_13105 [Roseivivax sp. THAF197b]QFT47569.1 hypothetical protein FIU97_13395 [Roseivivax sp. THAF40]